MDNFFDEIKKIFNYSSKKEEVNTEDDIEKENQDFHRRMLKNRKRATISSYNPHDLELCPNCVSEKLRERYSHLGMPSNKSQTFNEESDNYDKRSNFDSYLFSFSYCKDNNNNNNTYYTNNNVSNLIQNDEEEKKQKEKFNYFYNFALEKNNTANYPLIDYINYTKINNILSYSEKKNEISNMLLTHYLSYDLLLNFIKLIKQRSIDNIEDNEEYTYPFCCFIPIQNFSFDHITNFTSIFSRNKIMKYDMVFIPIQVGGDWNVIALNLSKQTCDFYNCGSETISINDIEQITNGIDAIKNWTYNHINLFSSINKTEQNGTLPLIVLDYLSRGQKMNPFTLEETNFYSVLIGIEIINQRLFTY